ncbi:MAG: hypothetical protein PVI30_17115 [Myxococcales bacterium]|jgi:hypothetical protein
MGEPTVEHAPPPPGPGQGPAPGEGALKPARAIGGTLNALVRATALYRKGAARFNVRNEHGANDTQRMVAERAVRAWRRATPNALDFEADKVRVGGDVALQADNEFSSWVLYAFMAGVRRIQPRPSMTTMDVIRLVQQLVTLEPTVKSIDAFRDWLDADGAEGFEVRVHTSFREVMEECDLEEEREFSKAFAMARFEVPRSGDAVYIAARDLDRVAMRREFEVPIEMYATEAATAAGGLSEEQLEDIGRRCDDANAWASVELQAVLTLPELRSAITPEQMARRVISRLAEEPDNRFLMLLTKLNARKDPFQRAVARALGTPEVGELISRQVSVDSDPEVEALGRFLVLSPEPVARAVFSGLLERALDDPPAHAALRSLALWYGAPQLCEWVTPEELDGEKGAMLGKALEDTGSEGTELVPIVSTASLEASLSMLHALPGQTMTGLGRPLRYLWGRAKPEMHEDLADMMIKGRARENLKFLGDKLVAGELDAWRGRTLYALCAALVELGFGRSHVLELAMRRGAHEQTRLIAIDCLRHDPKLAAEAGRFRVSRIFDSAAVRERFKQLREHAS